jgi:hypothetical protein
MKIVRKEVRRLGYFLVIWSVITYVEKRIKTKSNTPISKRKLGFLSHTFGMSL